MTTGVLTSVNGRCIRMKLHECTVDGCSSYRFKDDFLFCPNHRRLWRNVCLYNNILYHQALESEVEQLLAEFQHKAMIELENNEK